MELTPALFEDVRALIEQARRKAYAAVNAELVALYWEIGQRIKTEILKDSRAEYGEAVIESLSRQLTREFGSGFSAGNLRHFVKLAETFADREKVYALRRELSWTHLRTLMYLDDEVKRQFYLEMCRIERWSTRVLRAKIDGMLFERTAISRKPEALIREELRHLAETGEPTEDLVFRNPYVLDFLGLRDTFSEQDVESAILVELQRFLSELGSDFAFLARQKRITVDGEDYYIDLLFYHRRLRRLVVIDLKLGAFKLAYKGQMELYLRWLDRYERLDYEAEPIGLILCAEPTREHIELLMLGEGNIRVAQYLTELPPKKVLQAKLHEAIVSARQRHDRLINPHEGDI